MNKLVWTVTLLLVIGQISATHDSEQAKALHEIVSSRNEDKILELISKIESGEVSNQMINDFYNGQTLLHTAIHGCNTTLVEALLKRGADTNKSDDKGHRPLFYVNITYGNQSRYDDIRSLLSEYEIDLFCS